MTAWRNMLKDVNCQKQHRTKSLLKKCIWSKNKVYERKNDTDLDDIKLHARTNMLTFKSPLKKIVKSVTDVAKNQQKYYS